MDMGLEQSCRRYVGIDQILVEYCVLISRTGTEGRQTRVPSPAGCRTRPLQEATGLDNVYTIATR